VAGPRGAGKTSLLGSLLFEVERASRIIAIEDTEELPVIPLREIGYKALSLLIGENGNSTADKASADSVYKRAVDDMGVSPGSFSATDLVVVCGLVRPEGRRVNLRRVLQIAEVVKDGRPGEFRDLFLYDSASDSLEPTDELKRSSVINRIASTWGWKRKEVLGELETRSNMFTKTMKALPRDRFIRPRTEADMLQSFRAVRDEAAVGGWIGDRSKVLDQWMKAFTKEDQ